MQLSYYNYKYYCSLHDVFSADYHGINQYVIEAYKRPKKFIEETGPSVDRFLREYTIPRAPRSTVVPTHTILEFISQIDEFTNETKELFDEHKTHIDQCSNYLEKVSEIKQKHNMNKDVKIIPHLTQLTPELMKVHSELKKIKDKADYMTDKLEGLQNRWATIKDAIAR